MDDVVQRAIAKLQADKAAQEIPVDQTVPASLAINPADVVQPDVAIQPTVPQMPIEQQAPAGQLPALTADQLATLPSKEQLMQMGKQLPQVPTVADVSPIPADAIGKTATWLMQPAFQQEPVQAPAPVQTAVAAPPPKPSPEAAKQAVTPNQSEVDAATHEIAAPIRAAKAQQNAFESAEGLMREEQKKQAEREQQVNSEIAKLDSETRVKSLDEILSGGSFGQKLGAAIALGLGAVSQGLSGAKTNPVIDYMNSMVERQAQKDKLTQEKKESLRKQLFQQGELEMKKLENATTNAYRKEEIRVQREKLAMESGKIQQNLMMDLLAKQQEANKWTGKALTPQQVVNLQLEERKMLVQTPAGPVLVPNPEAKKQFDEYSIQLNNGMRDLAELRKLGQTTLKNPLSPDYWKAKARAEQLVQSIVGAIKLPYFGPGQFQKYEQDMARALVGNPLNFFSLTSFQNNLLDGLTNDFQAKLQNAARNAGIKEQVIPQVMRVVPTKGGARVAKTEAQIIRQLQEDNPKRDINDIKAEVMKYPSLTDYEQ